RWQLLQACRLIEKKGLHTTLEAFAQILAQYPHAHLTVAGDGPLQPALEKHAASLGITHSTHFTGFANQTELRKLVYASHLFFHPSQTGSDGNREGVPNAMLEAMATAMPVLTTRHGGIPEAVTHRSSGLLCDEKDAASLAANALEVIASPRLYKSLATGARQAVTDHFGRANQTVALENIYRLAIDHTLRCGTIDQSDQ
ncbi:MAG: glycosyltransferase, partial [Verrucomicrobiales bacterium]|nr:glycosyltransferase [Verrucomicrobiales bacterium]